MQCPAKTKLQRQSHFSFSNSGTCCDQPYSFRLLLLLGPLSLCDGNGICFDRSSAKVNDRANIADTSWTHRTHTQTLDTCKCKHSLMPTCEKVSFNGNLYIYLYSL